MIRPFLFLSLSLLLSGCAAVMDASAGRTPGARCLVKYDAVIQVPRTQWGTSSTFYYGFEYPSKQLVGWDWCHVYTGNLVQVVGGGDIGFNTRTVTSLVEPHCTGSIEIAALDDCRGGDSLGEMVFPFTKPMPVLRQY